MPISAVTTIGISSVVIKSRIDNLGKCEFVALLVVGVGGRGNLRRHNQVQPRAFDVVPRRILLPSQLVALSLELDGTVGVSALARHDDCIVVEATLRRTWRMRLEDGVLHDGGTGRGPVLLSTGRESVSNQQRAAFANRSTLLSLSPSLGAAWKPRSG